MFTNQLFGRNYRDLTTSNRAIATGFARNPHSRNCIELFLLDFERPEAVQCGGEFYAAKLGVIV